MRHLILGTALALAASTASVAGAQEVYQWKDASGVTHYSEAPPPSGSYQQRRITSSGASAGTDPTAAAAPAAENPQCTTARSNIALLQGDGPVAQEDGSELNEDERANQMELAQAAVRAYCADDASAD
ncbi:DUF4124 domain-containing protein [Luteimonas sp. RD2P54]|uniref:DUF4124 domain-containing protein n=1 Tax=Luteimonas endophytica TaxID=3042023 RepID=A0ABT6JD73_9GAMM|nr:DUF4124 domain-containing protein [Luteimonas endophytica]MDH5824772.1 DUF4124 domain-containing protein [Luteimonas endophytica]